jgi:hypothetical protein
MQLLGSSLLLCGQLAVALGPIPLPLFQWCLAQAELLPKVSAARVISVSVSFGSVSWFILLCGFSVICIFHASLESPQVSGIERFPAGERVKMTRGQGAAGHFYSLPCGFMFEAGLTGGKMA